ncbi:hypothetical protein [Xanthomonas campestris]|nr:hypothetical protein [Xanthomonas campestris]MEA9709179.1 hypothetical protein [Xanthomonas campestris pv. raphani]
MHRIKGHGMDTKEILVAIQVGVLFVFGLYRWFVAARREAKNKA